jgi:hypothetical protein
MSRFKGDYRRGFELVNGYNDHLHIPLETTSNYSAIGNLHTYKSPQQPLRRFAACSFFISRSLVTALNKGDSSASRAQILSSQPHVQNSTLKIPRLLAILHQPPSLLFTRWLSTNSLLTDN